MSLINEAMSCSSPVMASIPGSMRFKKESRSFKVEDTYRNSIIKTIQKKKRTVTVTFSYTHPNNEFQFVKQ